MEVVAPTANGALRRDAAGAASSRMPYLPTNRSLAPTNRSLVRVGERWLVAVLTPDFAVGWLQRRGARWCPNFLV
jgi:hypothetical protein